MVTIFVVWPSVPGCGGDHDAEVDTENINFSNAIIAADDGVHQLQPIELKLSSNEIIKRFNLCNGTNSLTFKFSILSRRITTSKSQINLQRLSASGWTPCSHCTHGQGSLILAEDDE